MIFFRRPSLRQSMRLVAVTIVAGLAMTSSGSRASGAADRFARVTDPSGGTIVAGTLGNESLPEATASLLRRIHEEFGKRPRIVQAARNASAHSVTLLFTEVRAGKNYTGMAIVTAGAGMRAGGAALFDISTRFEKTVGVLMHRLNAMTAPGTATKTSESEAPALPLITHAFGDGTGSIGVPAGWTVKAGGGSATVIGPGGVLVFYNIVIPAADPSNPRTQTLLRYQGPAQRRAFLARNAMLPYTGDPIKTWESIYAQLSKQAGKTGPAFHIRRSAQNGNITEIDGTYAFASHARGGSFSAFVFLTPPDLNGLWGMHDMSVWVPAPLLAKDAATAQAVLASVRIDFDAVARIDGTIREVYHQKFLTQLDVARRETQATTDRMNEAMADDRAAQENMHKQAVSMENYSLDRAVVVDTRNGEHDTIDSGFADTLVRYDANFQKVPARDLLRGVDY